MSSKKTTENKKSTAEETMIEGTILKLSEALASLKGTLGEKKFEKRIKKAVKLLLEGLKTAEPEKAAVNKVSAIKSTKSPAAKSEKISKVKSNKIPVKKSARIPVVKAAKKHPAKNTAAKSKKISPEIKGADTDTSK